MKSRRGFLNLQQLNCVTRLPAQIIWYFALTVFLLFGSAVFLVADEVPDEIPDKAAPSAFAPAKDLEQQITYFVKRLDKQLADEADYNEDRQINVERDASTLAVIAVVLANHDQPGELKASALLSSAQSLVEAAGDYAEAIQSLQALKDALAVKEDSASVDWESSGVDLSVLMKQVPIVNNTLRRGVSGRRFKRSADRSAGLAATLAALAHVSAFDDAYCGDEEDELMWRQFCMEMRDSSARANQAIQELDQKAAMNALDEIVESCDRCHEKFR